MENLTILIVFSTAEAISTATLIMVIAFDTKGFGVSQRGAGYCADFVKSAADPDAVLHHS
ncbi:hypothetical protein [Stenotrophomonas sp. BIGb0135]|uniref:hypothetical protein n=1 Tax=Stenotrophomonas sp. BIGb0135 TaxID=2940620 RepID=UPI002169BAF2|nr:hypothetical protein [Stenotrophomonas sp. BIGb0135]MCS4236961.1 hypothetical protein [Stenotrophomonas sp. BIGb0135]